MFASLLKVLPASVRLFLLPCVAGALLCGGAPLVAQLPPPPPVGSIHPFVVCNSINPQSTKVEYVLSYTSTAPDVGLLQIPNNNFFTPGEPDRGQPEAFFPGTDQDFFSVSFLTADTSFLIWGLEGQKFQLTPTDPVPPCRPSYFVPGPALSYPAAGSYPSQYLGNVSGFYNFYQYMPTPPPTFNAVVLPVANAAGISVTNVRVTTTPPPGFVNPSDPTGIGVQNQFVYADVTVAAGPASSTGLLVDIAENGMQLALGQTPISFAGSVADNTGCPATITNQVQGKIAVAKQLIDTGIWTQLVTFKNTSGKAIVGPIQLALAGLSSNARLFTSSGTGTCASIAGDPYITVAKGLPAGGNAAVVLTFTNSGIPTTGITYTPIVVAGGSRL